MPGILEIVVVLKVACMSALPRVLAIILAIVIHVRLSMPAKQDVILTFHF